MRTAPRLGRALDVTAADGPGRNGASNGTERYDSVLVLPGEAAPGDKAESDRLRILLLVAAAPDAAPIGCALERCDFHAELAVVTSRHEFIAALRSRNFDAVLSDYDLGDWSGMTALGVLRGMGLETPLILVSGSIGDEQAVECVKEGVADFVPKTNLGRLAIAIPRALEQARQRERFRALIEHSSDGIVIVSAAGTLVYVSPSGSRVIGVSPAELVGTEFSVRVHPGDVPTAHQTFEWVTAEPGRRADVQVRVKHGDGTWHWFEATVSNALDNPTIRGVVANFRDVSERHHAMEALRASDERFREITEHIKEALFIVDLEGFRTLYVSPQWGEIWGRPLSDGYDPRIWKDAIHPDDRAAMFASQARVVQGEATDNVFRVMRPDGTTRWVRGRAYPVRNAAGKVIRMVGVSADITELRETEVRFQQAQKMEVIGRLAGGVAHDFNNLLTVIIGYADELQHTAPTGSDMRTLAEDIFQAGQSAAVLTRQLLAFSRKQLIEPKVLPINDVVGDILKMLRRLIGEDITLETRLSPDAGAVRVDRSHIEQLITNLAVNARDAMPSGGVLSVETRSMYVEAGLQNRERPLKPGPYTTLSIIDSGVGMTEDVIARVFEPFFTTKEAGKGTGLGLATCHGIVEQAGGHITVSSRPGAGTTFTVYLPRVSKRTAQPYIHASATLPHGNETVLLVEDEDGVRKAAVRMLRSLGYDVLEAGDADAARQVLASSAAKVRLLITDVVLPGTTGRELAERVAQDYPSIKILFASGYSDDVILQNRLLANRVAMLPKPYTINELANKVREVLDG